jgi:hypothetical protein
MRERRRSGRWGACVRASRLHTWGRGRCLEGVPLATGRRGDAASRCSEIKRPSGCIPPRRADPRAACLRMPIPGVLGIPASISGWGSWCGMDRTRKACGGAHLLVLGACGCGGCLHGYAAYAEPSWDARYWCPAPKVGVPRSGSLSGGEHDARGAAHVCLFLSSFSSSYPPFLFPMCVGRRVRQSRHREPCRGAAHERDERGA